MVTPVFMPHPLGTSWEHDGKPPPSTAAVCACDEATPIVLLQHAWLEVPL